MSSQRGDSARGVARKDRIEQIGMLSREITLRMRQGQRPATVDLRRVRQGSRDLTHPPAAAAAEHLGVKFREPEAFHEAVLPFLAEHSAGKRHGESAGQAAARPRWAECFPGHEDILSRINPVQATHHTNAHVIVRGWTTGRACILGDAAHGQPPNLGQGAGLAIANAVQLAASVTSAATAEEGLAQWQARWRPVATMVQRWSYW